MTSPSKFGSKFINLHKTIVLTKPGVYDYEGLMHVWKGDGNCTVFGSYYPAMEIRSNGVVVKNFGVKGAKTGIVITDTGPDSIRSTVSLENVEARACWQALKLPRRSQNILIKDSIFVEEE